MILSTFLITSIRATEHCTIYLRYVYTTMILSKFLITTTILLTFLIKWITATELWNKITPHNTTMILFTVLVKKI